MKSTGISGKHYTDEAQKQSTHPRVGFYFDNIKSNHVVYRHYFNFVKCCHSNGIEVVFIKGPNAAKQTSSDLESKCSQSIQLYSNLEKSVKALRNLNLNMLVYTEIFSTSVPYCLAHSRIAPIQVVLPGNLITTGISTIDYFISSEYVETSSSANLYSERLIKLTGMPHGITEIPELSDRKNRSYFDLSEKSRVFGLLHNLIKFHPDWDKILEKIAKEDEEAVFLLTGKDSFQSIQLKRRWKESAPNFLSKCKFYRRLDQDDYFNLLACSDIVLDPLHMGCGTTSIDALSLGIPIITKPEENPRTRIAYGLYKIMGIKNAPIAYTDLDYIKFSTVTCRKTHGITAT